MRKAVLYGQRDVVVLALRKGYKYLFNPSEEGVINSEDAFIIMGETECIRKIKDTL
jgi:uncharacterized protein with PhoU and TrkA domain